MLASTDFELTTGSSETDLHSVVRWAHIAQKHHLVVRGMNVSISTYATSFHLQLLIYS